MITTNDLKKGELVKLANGWEPEIADNKKGNVRMAKVFGTYPEIGSIYSHDIIKVKIDDLGATISHTANQQKCKSLNESIFG